MIAESKPFEFTPLPTDEWLYAVVDKKPVDQESKFDKDKRTLTVLFRIEQDIEFNGKNIRGQKIPRMFPVNWFGGKMKKEPLLYQFVSVVAPEHAVKDSKFDTDLLEGRSCFIMIEDIKGDSGSTFQKVTKWKSPSKTSLKTPTATTAARSTAPVAVAVTADDGETVEY